jgi:hypothetical protein
MSSHQKSKGPAEAATSPSLGSTHPSKDQEMNAHSTTTAATVASTTGSLEELERLIAEHKAAALIDEQLWVRVGEIDDRLPDDLPIVRVQIGRILMGKNLDGSDADKPIYAYDEKKVDADIDHHMEAQLALCGRNEALIANVRERYAASKARLKQKLADLSAERKRIEDDHGYTAALAAARAQSDVTKALEGRIMDFVPTSIAAAARQAAWALELHEDEIFHCCKGLDLSRLVKSIARSVQLEKSDA